MSKLSQSIFLLLLLFPLVMKAQDSLQLSLDSTAFVQAYEEEVVVTGQFLPIGQSQTISPVQVISKDQIERQAALQLDELLQQALNIRLTQDGVLGGQLQLQGLEGNYVKILIDGVPVIGRNDGNIDLSRINLQNVERVEIVEGPLSTVYGSNALGGTINIITKKYQQSTFEGQLGGQAESNGRYSGQGSLAAKWKKLSWQGQYQYYYFDGFSTDTLRAQSWNPKQQHQLRSLLRWDVSNNWSLRYNFALLNEQIDDQGNIRLENFPDLAYANDFEFLTQTMDHNLSWIGLHKDYHFDGFVAYNNFRREKNAYLKPLLENPETIWQDSLNSDTSFFNAWHVRATMASEFRKKLDFQWGLDLRHEQASGARIALDENDARPTIGDYAVFGNLRYMPVDALQAQIGIRYAYNTRYPAPLTYNFKLRWNFKKYYSLLASYARGFRAPSLKELYLDFVDSNHFIKGNPDLKAERSHHVRLGGIYEQRWSDQQLSIKATGFYNIINDQITLQDFVVDSTGNFQLSEQATNEFAYFNLEEMQTLGGDVRISYSWKGLRLRLGAVLTGRYNALAKDYEQLSRFPATLEFNQEISYRLPKAGWTFSLFRKDYDRWIRYGTQYNPITQETTVVEYLTAGYTLMDLTVQKHLLDGSLRLGAGVRNLLNVTDVQQTGSAGVHGGGGVLPAAMGRTVFVQLKYNFKVK